MSERHLNVFELSALALNAATDDERSLAEAHLAACQRCSTLQGEMTEERIRFEQSVYPRTLPAIRERHGRSTSRFWALSWPRLLIPALALSAAAVFAVFAPRSKPTRFAVKGGPTLQVFAKRGPEVFLVKPETTVAPGDQLRFAVEPGRFGHLLLASLDGAQHVTFYYPYQGSESGPITPDTRSELPGSISLDATPGDERLFAILSDHQVQARDIVDQLNRSHDLSVSGAIVLTIDLHKVQR